MQSVLFAPKYLLYFCDFHLFIWEPSWPCLAVCHAPCRDGLQRLCRRRPGEPGSAERVPENLTAITLLRCRPRPRKVPVSPGPTLGAHLARFSYTQWDNIASSGEACMRTGATWSW